MIRILDTSFNGLGVVKNAIVSNRLEELNGENTLDFTAILDQKLKLLVDEDTVYELRGQRFDTALFKKLENEDGSCTVEVESQHVLYRLNNEEYNVEYFTEIGTPLYILGKILEGTGFTIGTIEFSTEETYSAQESKSRMQLLMEFVAYLKGELQVDNFVISILQHRGSTELVPVIKDRNIKVLSKTVNKRQKDENGDHVVSYACTPVYLPGQSYNIGDNVLLIQNDLGIRQELRVTSISYDIYDPTNVVYQFANYKNGLESSLYRISTSTVSKDKTYNGVRIGPEYGFEAVRNDKKARAYFRSDGMKFQSGDGTGENWKDRLYFEYDSDLDETIMVIDGKLSARMIEVLSVLITPSLYAEKANIAELTVDQLDTSTKVQRYLDGSTDDVNYIRISEQNAQWVTAQTDGAESVQLEDRVGRPLYWTDDTHVASTINETEWPVMIYVYTDYVKGEFSFYDDGINYVPRIVLGTGTGVYDNDKLIIIKQQSKAIVQYFTPSDGHRLALEFSEDGIILQGNSGEQGLRNMAFTLNAPPEPQKYDLWFDRNA